MIDQREAVCRIARKLSIEIEPFWKGVGPVWPLLERMRSEGAVVLIKLDGERVQPSDTGPYTALVFGNPLQDERIRTDAETIESALSYVIVEYARRVWAPHP